MDDDIGSLFSIPIDSDKEDIEYLDDEGCLLESTDHLSLRLFQVKKSSKILKLFRVRISIFKINPKIQKVPDYQQEALKESTNVSLVLLKRKLLEKRSRTKKIVKLSRVKYKNHTLKNRARFPRELYLLQKNNKIKRKVMRHSFFTKHQTNSTKKSKHALNNRPILNKYRKTNSMKKTNY